MRWKCLYFVTFYRDVTYFLNLYIDTLGRKWKKIANRAKDNAQIHLNRMGLI